MPAGVSVSSSGATVPVLVSPYPLWYVTVAVPVVLDVAVLEVRAKTNPHPTFAHMRLVKTQCSLNAGHWASLMHPIVHAPLPMSQYCPVGQPPDTQRGAHWLVAGSHRSVAAQWPSDKHPRVQAPEPMSQYEPSAHDPAVQRATHTPGLPPPKSHRSVVAQSAFPRQPV